MSWLDLPRVPEPEVMDDSAEVEAYSSAAAQAFLDKIDDTFVEHALRLVTARRHGRALDIGTGPGQIVLRLARRLPGWHFIGVDRSANMIAQARSSVAEVEEMCRLALSRGCMIVLEAAATSDLAGSAGVQAAAAALESGSYPVTRLPFLPERVQFLIADGNRLPFPDAGFDLVMCNSVLHHLAEPQRLFAEVARLVKPEGAILVRDLRRPSRLAYPLHVRWHGRHYSGLMYKLFCASVRSAYTVRELEALLRASPLAPTHDFRGVRSASAARVFTHHRTHLGLERPAAIGDDA